MGYNTTASVSIRWGNIIKKRIMDDYDDETFI